MNCTRCLFEMNNWDEIVCKICNKNKCLDSNCIKSTDSLYCKEHIEREKEMNKIIKERYKILQMNDMDIYF